MFAFFFVLKIGEGDNIFWNPFFKRLCNKTRAQILHSRAHILVEPQSVQIVQRKKKKFW